MVEYRDYRGQEYVVYDDRGCLLTGRADDAPKDWDCGLKFAKDLDVGMDLPVLVDGNVSCVRGDIWSIKHGEYFKLCAGSIARVPTGIRVKIPGDAWGSIIARSSTGFKRGLIVPGNVIDPGYIGPLYTLLYNPTNVNVDIQHGEHLSQLVLFPRYNLKEICKVTQFKETERGDSGFGSSGI